MLKISRLADYATVLMSVLASESMHLTSVDLAAKTSIKLPTVRKVMKMLNEADLVESLQGANGGYQLAVEASQISMVAIIAAIDGLPAMTECAKATVHCEQQEFCGLRGNWQKINQLVVQVLSDVSLADMLQPVEQPLVFHAQDKKRGHHE